MFFISLYLAKISFRIIRLLKLGSGYTWPGHLALKIYPHVLQNKRFNLKNGYIFVTGTNGKTTTVKLISHILASNGFNVVYNKSGANLLNGIVSELLLKCNVFGRLSADVGVLEVDEFALTTLLKYIKPRVLVLLNLSRDQLDRYGETDTVLEKWLSGFSKLDPATLVVVDSTQKEFENIQDYYRGKIFYFDDSYEAVNTSLKGDFNTKNINASLLVCTLLGVDKPRCIESIEYFDEAYGRGEVIKYKESDFKIFLAKNPSSYNNNLDMLLKDFGHVKNFLCILNDNIPDGRDISWIYDIDPAKIESNLFKKNIHICGTRALDLALRFRYAGVRVPQENIHDTVEEAVAAVVKAKPENVVVLPNYSSMLEVRKVLTGRKIL